MDRHTMSLCQQTIGGQEIADRILQTNVWSPQSLQTMNSISQSDADSSSNSQSETSSRWSSGLYKHRRFEHDIEDSLKLQQMSILRRFQPYSRDYADDSESHSLLCSSTTSTTDSRLNSSPIATTGTQYVPNQGISDYSVPSYLGVNGNNILPNSTQRMANAISSQYALQRHCSMADRQTHVPTTLNVEMPAINESVYSHFSPSPYVFAPMISQGGRPSPVGAIGAFPGNILGHRTDLYGTVFKREADYSQYDSVNTHQDRSGPSSSQHGHMDGMNPEDLRMPIRLRYCLVCEDDAVYKHYGIYACEGCKSFFKRSVQNNTQYVCQSSGTCTINKTTRNRCQGCRFNKCINVGMDTKMVRTAELKGKRGRLGTLKNSC